jgi:TetR/AcrR family transcriptional repressor of nem operon
MSAKAEQKERTHETILASASRLLREKGISGARVADVMKGAGLTVGGFYAHFASKEALVDEALRRTTNEIRRRLFEGLDDRPVPDRLDVVLRRYLSTIHRDHAAEGCPFPAVIGEVLTSEGTEHREVLREQIGAYAAELERHLPPSQSPQLSKRHRALAIIALMHGGLSLARALRGTELSEEILRACRAFARASERK